MSGGDLLQQGLAHHRAGRPDAARRCYRALLAAAPDHVDGLHLLGLASRDLGDVAEAERCLRGVVARAPHDADAWHGLGLLLLQAGRAGDALPCLRTAAACAPRQAEIAGNLGACLHRLGRLQEAATALRAALALAPDLPAPRACLGLVLAALGDAAGAEQALRTALAQRPDLAANHTNLGNLLRELGRFEAAEAALRRAVALAPTADAQHNLAAVLAARGRPDEAAACCRAALLAAPDHADARYTLGAAQLLAGAWPEGFAGLEWRWRRRGFAPPRHLAQPQWDGGARAGGTLLLHAEQGLGDAIQMLRFVPALARAGPLLLQVPQPLRRLAERLPGGAIVRSAGEELPAFDRHCPLPSLPWALRLRLDELPGPVPYLSPPPAARAAWQPRVAALPGVRVGLAWAGNRHFAADARRSIDPARLALLAGVPGVSFVSLQPGMPPPDALPMHDWTADFGDLADTAGLIDQLDLVIAVDTAVAHLAGALGRPVWLLNRFDTCWRWLLGRDDSPWYPSLRQFRQPHPGDWDAVLAAVRAALAQVRPDACCRGTPRSHC